MQLTERDPHAIRLLLVQRVPAVLPTKQRHTWTRDEIASKLATDDRWLVRGILAIYERQTADERASQTTRHYNGIGFNAWDAGLLSSFAQQILRRQATGRLDLLSPAQIAKARPKMRKYATQLAAIANES